MRNGILAIHYYDAFSAKWSSRNFGDDINPYLLGKLLDPSIVASTDVCVLGVGTILNRDNVSQMSHFRRKVVFSTGTGYGEVPDNLDDSWDFVCVRGPLTAEAVGLPPSNAICDGAILLSDYFEPVVESRRSGVVFIPHIRTHWGTGKPLEAICSNLNWRYLPPDVPAEEFIERVSSAALVITEAMHGAILADSLRVPWISVALHYHNDFKWRDWFMSIEQDYCCETLLPKLWNSPRSPLRRQLKRPYQSWKMNQLQRQLHRLATEGQPSLSDEEVLVRRKRQLREKLDYINSTYAIPVSNVQGM